MTLHMLICTYVHNTRNDCAVLQNVHSFACDMYGTCFNICRANLMQFPIFHVSRVFNFMVSTLLQQFRNSKYLKKSMQQHLA